jgi:hypothetical protein
MGCNNFFSTFFRRAKHAFSLGFFAIIAQYAAFTRTKKPPSADANDGFFWSFFARHFADCVNSSAVTATGSATLVPVYPRARKAAHMSARLAAISMSIICTSGCAALYAWQREHDGRP